MTHMASRPPILISVITRDTIEAETAEWLTRQTDPVDIVKTPFTIEHQRNLQVKRFLNSELDWLLFIDNDVIPPVDLVDRLWNERVLHEKAIMVAPPWTFTPSNAIVPMAYRQKEDGLYYPIQEIAGIHRVDMTGMSGTLVPRQILEAPWRKPFRMVHDEFGRLVHSEDVMFWTDLWTQDIFPWVNLDLICDHVKPVRLSMIKAGVTHTMGAYV